MPDRVDAPLFTVVIATFGRGSHIAPTIASLRGQTITDFEAFVIGDGVSDDTLDHVSRDDPRLKTINLPSHTGSQSAPNNAGISVARGKYIAYLGHDDVWMPDHLKVLGERLVQGACDVAVSGCAYHGPPGTNFVEITGLFDDPSAARSHFFPPTSFGHRTSLAAEIGGWRKPNEIAAPVDADFVLRAVDAGAKFVSTGRLTAHKFAAGHRYLSTLDPSSAEQRETVAAIQQGTIDEATCAVLVERAKAAGTFMRMIHPDFTQFRPGDLFRLNRSNKGIDRATTQPLIEEVYLPQTPEPRALDWYPPEQNQNGSALCRWSGPSLRPRLLIPLAGNTLARITLHLANDAPDGVLEGIRITMNGQPVRHRISQNKSSLTDIQFSGWLRPDKPSALQLILQARSTGDGSSQPQRGILLEGMTVTPASRISALVDQFLNGIGLSRQRRESSR